MADPVLPPGEPPWPTLLDEFTKQIDRFHRTGDISDGQLFIFGMTMVWHATRDLTIPDRHAKVEEVLKVIEEEDSHAANDTGPVQPGGKEP